MQDAGLRPFAKTPLRAPRTGNRRLVLQHVFDDGPISRADLARATGLGRATVSDITAELLAEGLVFEAGTGSSTGGKPPTLVELDPAGRSVIAVDLSRHPIRAGLLSLRGRILTIVKGKAIAPTGKDALEELHQVIGTLLGDAGSPTLGIGLGVPGAVSDDGVVSASTQLGWSDLDLRDQLEDVYRIPTHVAGDAEVAAVAEFGRSGSAPSSSMLYVKVDDRIAVSVILTGRLHRTGRWGGELTHLAVAGLTGRCSCGRIGCLATEVSVISVLGSDYADMGTEERRRLASETRFDAGHAGRVLGTTLAPIVGSLQVDRVVIGGELSEWPGVADGIAAGIVERLTWAPDVVPTMLGDVSVVLGAAGMVLSSELGVVWS